MLIYFRQEIAAAANVIKAHLAILTRGAAEAATAAAAAAATTTTTSSDKPIDHVSPTANVIGRMDRQTWARASTLTRARARDCDVRAFQGEFPPFVGRRS